MKAFVAFLLAAIAPTSAALADAAADFNTLEQQRRAAIDQAVHEIDVRYVARLAALQQAAAQQQNYELAAKIKKEIKAHTPAQNFATPFAPPQSASSQNDPPKQQLRDYLIAHDWTLVDTFAGSHAHYHFHFTADSIVGDPGVVWNRFSKQLNHWVPVSGDEFRLDAADAGFSLFFKVDRSANAITLDKEKSPKEHRTKQILFGDQSHSAANSETSDTNDNTHYFGTKDGH